MIKLLRKRYLLIRSDGLTRLEVPWGEFWTLNGAKRSLEWAKAAQGDEDRYAWWVAVR